MTMNVDNDVERPDLDAIEQHARIDDEQYWLTSDEWRAIRDWIEMLERVLHEQRMERHD